MKNKIEMKEDGKDGERFQTLLKTVVNVPKKDIQERETKDKASKIETAKKQS